MIWKVPFVWWASEQTRDVTSLWISSVLIIKPAIAFKYPNFNKFSFERIKRFTQIIKLFVYTRATAAK